MKKITPLILSVTMLGFISPAGADVLELKSGSVLNGKYVGGTAGTVRFETSAGVQVVETAQIIALTFTTAAVVPGAAPASTPATPVAATPAPAAQAANATIPAGTMLLVRMMDSVSSQSADGAKFTTKLEYDLVVNGAVAVKAGTVIYGKVQNSTQARRATGKSTLDIRLAQISAGAPRFQLSPAAISRRARRRSRRRPAARPWARALGRLSMAAMVQAKVLPSVPRRVC